MREIEIKFKVESLEPTIKQLEALGYVLSEPIIQHDSIYSKNGETNVWAKSQTGDTVIRLRQQGSKILLTLKQQQTHETDNLEYELEISNYEAMDQILKVLEWVPVIEVKKIRQKVKLGEYEVCLDTVEELGSFVEIEKLVAAEVDVEAVREEILTLAKKLELDPKDEIKLGYDTQMYHLKY